MPKVNETLRQYGLLAQVEHGLDRLNLSDNVNEMIGIDMRTWDVVINHRANCRSGLASSGRKRIELTHAYFDTSGREADRNQTMLHEVAHLVVFRAWPHANAHGREWKIVMRAFGAKPDRCSNHSYLHDKREQNAKHKYECKDCDMVYLTMRKLKNAHLKYHGECKHKPNGGKLNHTLLR